MVPDNLKDKTVRKVILFISFVCSAAHLDIPSQVIQPNQTENVYVAFAKSSSEICVQLASYSDQLDQVMATIELEIQSQATLKEDQVVPGMVCCAYFEDGWYRAVITSKTKPRKSYCRVCRLWKHSYSCSF